MATDYELEILAKHSKHGLQKSELDRAAKKAHLLELGYGRTAGVVEKTLNELYGELPVVEEKKQEQQFDGPLGNAFLKRAKEIWDASQPAEVGKCSNGQPVFGLTAEKVLAQRNARTLAHIAVAISGVLKEGVKDAGQETS